MEAAQSLFALAWLAVACIMEAFPPGAKITRTVIAFLARFHREAFHDILPQPLRSPDAELGASLRFHPVAHRDDHIEVVVSRVIGFPIGGSYPEFPDN